LNEAREGASGTKFPGPIYSNEISVRAIGSYNWTVGAGNEGSSK